MTAREIYIAAREKRNPAERADYIGELCRGNQSLRREVEALLAAHPVSDPGRASASSYGDDEATVEYNSSSAASTSAAPSSAASSPSSADVGPEQPGGWIGRFKLIRKLGEGGMGVVYLAHQSEPIRRDVALKILKPGMDSKMVIARFETERQALAVMDHPNIARVLDAGATSAGRPYFVMDLVDGLPITRYCDAKRLELRERLELFVPVCQAIQHAHQKGIIHRDVKPSNILVIERDGRPVPKVIDFGIAKAMGQELTDATAFTNLGTIMGTPEYMSPEQADLGSRDIDTRADIYSLGAVLYELLTDATPLGDAKLMKSAYLEMLRRIREEAPQTPSARLSRSGQTLGEISSKRRTDPGRLPRLMQGEIDWIVMKALEKDRTRRYETANGLARDIQRYLGGEPVEAGPPSAAYRMRKFAVKHRLWLGVAAAFAAVLLAGALLSAWMALRAKRAEQVAQSVNAFLENDLLAQASAINQSQGTPDPDIKVRTVLDRAASQIQSKFAGEPEVEASIRHTVGATYFDLGIYAEAARQLERAVELRRSTLGPNHRATLSSMGQLASLYLKQGRHSEAETLDTKVLETQRRTVGAYHTETLKTMDNLAMVYLAQGKYAQAEALDSQALELEQRKLGPEHSDTLGAMSDLASIYTEQGKYEQAEPLFTKALEIRRRVLGPDHPLTLSTMSDLSVLYSKQKRHAESEALQIKLLESCRRVFGPEHPNTLNVMSNLAVTYSDQGKYAQSESLNQQTMAGMRRVLGPEHPATLTVMNNLGVAYKIRGKFAEAEELDTQILASFRRVLGPEHPNTLASMSNLGLDYWNLGKYSQAEALFRPLLEARRRKPGSENASTLRAAYILASTLFLEGKYAEAEALLRQDLAVYVTKLPDSWERSRCQSLLGAVLSAEHKYGEAEPLLLAGVHGLLQREPEITWYGKSDPDRALEYLTRLYDAWGKRDKAAEWRSQLQARKARATAPQS